MSLITKKTTGAAAENSPIGANLSFAAAEAYKLLRANLMFSLTAKDSKCRVVGITSSMPNEGKSTTSINLAYSIAETGKRVLIIDGDMRLPTLAKRLNINRSPGLSNLLAGLCSGADVLRASGIHDNLHALPAGDIPPNPNELLGSELMESVIDSLKNNYDYIIVDLPPVTSVSDGLVISKLLDGIIIVVRRNYCDQQSLAEAMRQIEFRHGKVLGFVLTRSEISHKNYKKYKKYKKGYGYGYGYGYGNNSRSGASSGTSQGGQTKVTKVEKND